MFAKKINKVRADNILIKFNFTSLKVYHLRLEALGSSHFS